MTSDENRPCPSHTSSLIQQPFGILGGTFDPIHHGHLRLAEELAEALGLAEVRILPTGTPPHRGQPHAPAHHRLAMTRLAIAGNPCFRVDEHEIHKSVPCYMVDTLTELRGEVGGDCPIVLFLGADAFAGLESWHEWRRLFDLCHIAVADRPGYDFALPDALAQEYATRLSSQPDELANDPAGRIFRHAITALDISASRIRTLKGAGHSLRYLLPADVLDYIDQHYLY